jgi:phosphoribosylamine---glycine ligase
MRSLRESRHVAEPVLLHPWRAPGVVDSRAEVLEAAKKERPDFVIIGPEEPLALGVVDALQALGIPCVGPTQVLAQLESSKAFTRDLVAKYKIPGNPRYAVFRKAKGIREFLQELGSFAVKPDGLTGGKGVKVSEVHLFSIDDALAYCEEILQSHSAVVIEEKLEGEEFSLQSFSDGRNVAHMVVVQDHKRAYNGDTGPNTGGMGSYSCADGSLPFLKPEHVREAEDINKAVADALYRETGQRYKGILYGGFMITANGLRLLEYNARFGDPETLNVLSILKTDFGAICESIINETLDPRSIEFERLATVCKYVVPEGYPERPAKPARIDLSGVPAESSNLRSYDAAIERRPDGVYLTGSRAIAFVGIGKDLQEAESIAEHAASSVKGPVRHRSDIGTPELIRKRIEHVDSICRKRS